MAHPALQLARRRECIGVNAAGRLLADYASATECVLGTGRALGDVGQATFVGSPGQTVASRPDHVIMSSKVYGAAQSARITLVRHISDHCTILYSLVFRVDDVSYNADWTLQTAHVCSSGGCGSNFVLNGTQSVLGFMAKSWQTVQ